MSTRTSGTTNTVVRTPAREGRGRLHAACVAVLLLVSMTASSPAGAGFLDLEWTAPTTNTDGSPLLDLAAYRVYSATSTPTCPGPDFQTLTVSDPSPAPSVLESATLTGVTTGTTYWIRVSAVDTAGNEGPCTTAVGGVARTNIDATPATLAFGSVDIGASATLDFTVENMGSAALTGTATTAVPFSIVSGGTLNIAPGATQLVRVRFTPLAGQLFAGSVSFTTSIDSLTRSVSGTGVVTTPDVLQFTHANVSVTEGGTATITVTRTGGTVHGAVTVDYATTHGTASSGDYTSASGTLTFNPGVTSQTFTVATTPDSAVEPAETVILTLSNPQGGATLGTVNPATLTITNEDVGGSLQFNPVTYTVGESGGSVTLTVTRTGGSASGVTVAYATANGTATAGSDYSSRSGTLTFDAGTTSRTISVPILQDSASSEPSETFTVTLSHPQSGATLGAASTATVTITDDEPRRKRQRNRRR